MLKELSLDDIQIVLWSMTYLMSIFMLKKYREKKECVIPLNSVGINFAWEINAIIISRGFWGHILWLLFDSIILFYSFRTIGKSRKRKNAYVKVLICIGIFFVIFRIHSGGMLASSFVINFIMSALFFMKRDSLLSNGKCMVAFTKMIGTLAATIYYQRIVHLIGLLGFIILVIDFLYFCSCVKSKYNKSNNI